MTSDIEVLENLYLVALREELEAVREPLQEVVLLPRRRARYDAHGAARMHEGIVRSPHFHPRHDLRAGGDVVSVIRHCGERAELGRLKRAKIC